jgi:hypothetical protein
MARSIQPRAQLESGRDACLRDKQKHSGPQKGRRTAAGCERRGTHHARNVHSERRCLDRSHNVVPLALHVRPHRVGLHSQLGVLLRAGNHVRRRRQRGGWQHAPRTRAQPRRRAWIRTAPHHRAPRTRPQCSAGRRCWACSRLCHPHLPHPGVPFLLWLQLARPPRVDMARLLWLHPAPPAPHRRCRCRRTRTRKTTTSACFARRQRRRLRRPSGGGRRRCSCSRQRRQQQQQ